MKMNYYYIPLFATPHWIKFQIKLMRKAGYFVLFPSYWELIPVRLEKAIALKYRGANSRKGGFD